LRNITLFTSLRNIQSALLYVIRIIVAVTESLYSKSFSPELAVTEPLAPRGCSRPRRNPVASSGKLHLTVVTNLAEVCTRRDVSFVYNIKASFKLFTAVPRQIFPCSVSSLLLELAARKKLRNNTKLE